MMALQLQSYADLRLNGLDLINPIRGRKARTWTNRRRIGVNNGLIMSSISSLGSYERVPLAGRRNGMHSTSVAAPDYASLRRRERLQEMKIDAGDKIMQLAEWVSNKVKDPLVEIDPVTVNKRIFADEQIARAEAQALEQVEDEPVEANEENIATVASSTLGQTPPGFPRGMNDSTKAAGAALILVTVGAAYLAFCGNSTESNPKELRNSKGTHMEVGSFPGSGPRERAESSPPQDLHQQFSHASNKDKPESLSASGVSTSSETQSCLRSPVPAFSTNLEQTVLPVTPHKSHLDEECTQTGGHSEDLLLSVSKSQVDDKLSAAEPLEDVVADKDNTRVLEIEDIYYPEAKSLQDVIVVNGVGILAESADDDRARAKPFEDVVAVNERASPAKIEDLEFAAMEFAEALVIDEQQILKQQKKHAVEEVNLGLVETPVNGEVLVEASSSELVDDLVGISEVNLPGVEFQNAMLSGTSPAESAPFQLRPVDECITLGTSNPQLVEDPVVFNLSSEPLEFPLTEEPPVGAIQNGASTTISSVDTVVDRFKSYAEAIEAVFPALAVGAGALSTLGGVDSGLQMVGLVATASFLAREVFMATSRQKLCGEVRQVTDYKSFVDFLKTREIIPDVPEE